MVHIGAIESVRATVSISVSVANLRTINVQC